MSHYTVRTQDIDGRSSRRFKTLDGAVKRFEEMLGLTTDQAIAEVHHKTADMGLRLPKIAELGWLSYVSLYGTKVTFEASSDEAKEAARVAREAAAEVAETPMEARLREVRERADSEASDTALEASPETGWFSLEA